ncbi:glutamate-cysteine ligase family protein [Streptomyces sp. NPDC021356]|uniref:glutamate-cysteine ligase family protein n=1 Tax=Streptomyces sp. NPDC021356 TaxID=3154900 RepID=UPI0033C0EA7A
MSDHLRPWLPTPTAPAANSPCWASRDTAYAGWRTTTWGRWPVAGPPPYLDSPAHFQDPGRRTHRHASRPGPRRPLLGHPPLPPPAHHRGARRRRRTHPRGHRPARRPRPRPHRHRPHRLLPPGGRKRDGCTSGQ